VLDRRATPVDRHPVGQLFGLDAVQRHQHPVIRAAVRETPHWDTEALGLVGQVLLDAGAGEHDDADLMRTRDLKCAGLDSSREVVSIRRATLCMRNRQASCSPIYLPKQTRIELAENSRKELFTKIAEWRIRCQVIGLPNNIEVVFDPE
jgi:hypothetical protein